MLVDVAVLCVALSCLRGCSLGYVLAFAIAARSVLCFFVCDGGVAEFVCCLIFLMNVVVLCFVL